MKILRLEREQGYKNTAVIGGLGAFAKNWQGDAHAQARRPEHHELVDELVGLMQEYDAAGERQDRHLKVKYMIGRITGRVQPGQSVDDDDAGKGATRGSPPGRAAPQERAAPRDRAPSRSAERPAKGSQRPTGRAPQRREQAPPQDRQAEQGQAEGSGQPDQRRERRSETITAIKARKDGHTPASMQHEEARHQARTDLQPGSEDAVQAETARSKPRRRTRREFSPEESIERLHGLNAPVTVVERVGERMAEKLARLGIHTVEDLIYHLPRRYDDYTRLVPIHQAKPGEVYTLIGSVRSTTLLKTRTGRDYLQMLLDDGTATLTVFFFGQPYLSKTFKRGVQVVVSGKTDLQLGHLSMSNPEWELLEYENLHTRAIVPVYPLTKGLTARTMRRILKSTVDYWAGRLPDYMPEIVLERADLVDLGWALNEVHFPDNWDYLKYARERLAFDELFLLQMAMLARRRAWQDVPAVPLEVEDAWLVDALTRLPFALTGAQNQALADIRADLARRVPMNRLMQGDVGSGKTVVAALALALAFQNGGQAALMAPTSILAEQHYHSITSTLAALIPDREIAVRLLTGATPAAERAEILARLAEGSVSILIGTHALIQDGVDFANLTLAVIDEQHRFGVEQRGRLRGKGTNPHLLVMTATPIPRTLALTLHADLDLTVIDELPPGRTPVETYVLNGLERERAYSFVDQQVEQGHQAFIVYPLVEAEEAEDETRAAVDEFERLRRDVFRTRRLGLLHGRMRPDEKDAVMAAFKAGELDILVSTSVVEVGIDVPNATAILIEDASHFGLAQLHQFRGRVGRGEFPSTCLLIGDTTLPGAAQRLEAMARTTDGFELAEVDFQMRGAGDLFGTRQSGLSAPLRFGQDLYPPLVALAQREARTLYEEDPGLSLPEHRLLAERVAMWRAVQTDFS